VSGARDPRPRPGAHGFLHPPPGQTDATLALPLTPARFPHPFATTGLAVAGVELLLMVADAAGYAGGAPLRLEVTPPGGGGASLAMPGAPEAFAGMPHGGVGYGASPEALGAWSVAFREADNVGVSPTLVVEVDGHRRLDPAAVTDLIVAVRYRVG
jgi:hypothetical protein